MKIRNFCIIAHIDHGKSTLSDRIIELCLNLAHNSISNCFLDSMQLEKEKGITIKLASIRLNWKDYCLNLIDTPGHIDFSAEVFRSLKASEGGLLLVDLTKGVQAQTLSLFKKAREEKLKLIPVLNKIDSPLVSESSIQEVLKSLCSEPFCFEAEECRYISARTGEGVRELLDYLIEHIPSPKEHRYLKLELPFVKRDELCALVFEAEYHNQRGTILTVRVFSGEIVKGSEICLAKAKHRIRVRELEFLSPKSEKVERIKAGEVGRVYVFLPKGVELEPGEHLCTSPLPPKEELDLLPSGSFVQLKPMIFSFIAPFDESQRALFANSLAALKLSDSSLEYKFMQSSTLGFGANVGALGPLHLEILHSRLEQEFKLQLVNGPATIEYKAILNSGEEVFFSSAHQIPKNVSTFLEPYLKLEISLPLEHEKEFVSYLSSRRGVSLLSLRREERELKTEHLLPLAELNSSFIHSLFGITKGYITYSYSLEGYYPLSLSKVSICINDLEYPELSFLAESSVASHKARELLLKLKTSVAPQLYELALQAKIGGKVIARENVRALRKAVAAKCYGGDISRKKKLWERQAEGKKKMKQESRLQLPHSFFKSLVSTQLN